MQRGDGTHMRDENCETAVNKGYQRSYSLRLRVF